jgi:CDP-archaeol synthase
MLELKLFMLIIVANGSPIAARKLLGARWQSPLDAGKRFIDNQPLFGATKTWRGILTACLLTSLAAWLMHLSFMAGFLIALGAMLGDLCSSFIKRRLGMSSSSMALGLDQIPESLLPLLLVKAFGPAILPPPLQTDLTWAAVWQIVAMFVVAELLVSRLLYRLQIRNRPY